MAKSKGKSKAVRQTSGEDEYDRLQRLVSSDRRTEFHSLEAGKTTVRIFGFEHDGEKHVAIKEFSHFILDGNKSIAHADTGCALCEWAEEQIKEVAKNYRPKAKYLVNAIIRGENGEADKQVRLPLAITAMEGQEADGDTPAKPGILELARKHNAFDLEKGRDFTIDKTGKKLTTRYRVTIAQKASPIGMKVKPVDLFLAKRKPLLEGEMESVVIALKKKYGR